jgi:hypothetical protein
MAYEITGDTTGARYTVHWHEECQCWTWSDKQNRGPSLGWDHNRHSSSEAAARSAQERDRVRAAEGGPLTREQYETECARFGVPARPDHPIGGAFTVQDYTRGDIWMPEYPVPRVIETVLAQRRWRALSAEPTRQVDVVAALAPGALALGKVGPEGAIYKPDASVTDLRCARCGAPAMWIGGAGEALCYRHQDDY